MRTRKAGGAAKHVFSVGEIHGRVTQRAEELAQMLTAVDGATVTKNLWGERWAKLSLNSMHNGLAGITGLNHHGVAENVVPRRISIQLGGEAIRIGRALGYDIGNIRKQPPEVWLAAADGDAKALKAIEDVVLDEVTKMTDAGRPSTAQDIVKGRRTEIEYINGYIAEKGREAGIATPMQQMIVELVQEIELGKLKPSEANVARLATMLTIPV
jgi:2-dehydropantoate 2-reductase